MKRSRMLRALFHTVIVIVLTVLTQLGGIAWLLAVWITRGALRRLLAFLGVYAALMIGAVIVAPLLGRESLPCFERDGLAPRTLLTCAFNRQFVTPEMAALARDLAQHVRTEHPDSLTLYLDGNFPFFVGFPLLPHLSHDDGRKLDFAFYYRDSVGRYLPGVTPSPLGYWGFIEPHAADPKTCGKADRFTMRWDMRWFQRFVDDSHDLEPKRTATMLRWLASEGVDRGVEKVLLEPHLRARFALPPKTVRFQGCSAARHDDHVHIQIR